MRRITKLAAVAALPLVGLGIATTGAANAAPAANAATSAPAPGTPILDTPDYVSYATNCTPGVTTHTDYKWVPNVTNAGPTMWTVNDVAGPATFSWKGAPVGYHRDGTKTQQATDTHCGVRILSQTQADNLMAQGTINEPVDVPASVDVQLRYVTVNGDVTVEGHLSMASDVVNGNVYVTGDGRGNIDGSGLTLFNDASHITGNLTVTSSGGYSGGNSYGWTLFDNANGTTQVDGGLTFQNNAGGLYISNGGMHVAGNFSASGNRTYVWPVNIWTTDGLHVSGTQTGTQTI
jgi:hypothetical protein